MGRVRVSGGRALQVLKREGNVMGRVRVSGGAAFREAAAQVQQARRKKKQQKRKKPYITTMVCRDCNSVQRLNASAMHAAKRPRCQKCGGPLNRPRDMQ